MAKTHTYNSNVTWSGAGDTGTKNYKSYKRSYDINIGNKPIIAGSADPAFLGDPACHNPEDLLMASVSSCHMLWYLHLCSVRDVTVKAYSDQAEGTMTEEADGSGKFIAITLKPHVVISAQSDLAAAKAAHDEANKKCFIANSLNFNVGHEATFELEQAE